MMYPMPYINKEKNSMEYEEKKFVYVVEGNTDEDKLKKLGVTYIVKTGGKFIRNDILLFLKEIKKNREIILLTDPDGPGREINSIITKSIGECHIVKADKRKAISHNKVGIAEMKTEDINELLLPYLDHDKNIGEQILSTIDMVDLNLIGPLGKERKERLINLYHIPFSTSKNVLNALNMLSLTKDKINEVLDD